MLAIGRGLMTNPTLLLMDEPSEGLAPAVLGMIRERLQELRGPDLSILLVEQNLGLALQLGDRVEIMADQGRIVWQGRPDELESDPKTAHKYLGV
jgi:branched-chain amino acid transport system ATP-binding protein